jgi:competence protein ComEA
MLITDIIDNLVSLCNLDNDAIKSYDIAIKKVSEPDISSHIKAFRDDHVRHVESLTRIITGLGGAHPIPSGGDIRGLFLGAATALQSSFGTEGALKGLQGGEKITTRSYEDAVGKDFPPDILSVLSQNYQDEKVHLDQITKMIDSRAWEHKRAA